MGRGHSSVTTRVTRKRAWTLQKPGSARALVLPAVSRLVHAAAASKRGENAWQPGEASFQKPGGPGKTNKPDPACISLAGALCEASLTTVNAVCYSVSHKL